MNSEHAEVLERLRERCAALDAAIASLSAPAEAQAQGCGEDREPDDGKVVCPACCHQFRAIPVQVQRDMIAAGFEPPFTAPPSAPVGVEWSVIVEGLRLADQFFDGDTDHWQWDDGEFFPADKVRAAYQAALAQQPAADGGFTAADMMDARQEGRKEAQQLAAVDGLNVWRAAFIAERSARYREDGMGIEQAHIHAETDASRIAARAALRGGSDNDR